MLGFESDDFSYYFDLFDDIGRILGSMINNRKERYLLTKGLSDSISIALYFPKDWEPLVKDSDVEFIL